MDTRKISPAALRNRDPILTILRKLLPESGLVLEIASGSGEHIVHFAGALPALSWQPSDPDPQALASVAAWAEAARLPNMLPPIAIDAAARGWPLERADAILCINMVHISPWAATLGLLQEAGRLLPSGAPLILYGPYERAGVETAASNRAFDADLKARNPQWGLRSVEAVAREAAARSLRLALVETMPANNLMLVFRAD